MKAWILLFGMAAGLSAQQGRGFGRGPAIGFATLDTDEDGVISKKEIAKAPAALLKLDKNKDGQITEDEVRPNFGERGPRGEGRGPEREATGPSADELVQTLMAFDKDKDGRISKSELPERMQGMFDRGDTDKDGFLTEAEIRAMATAQVPAGGGRGGFGGGRGGGMMRFDPILAAIDTDHDGTLSAEEIRNAPAALRTLDKNGDGEITPDEAMPSLGGRGFGRGRGEGRE